MRQRVSKYLYSYALFRYNAVVTLEQVRLPVGGFFIHAPASAAALLGRLFYLANCPTATGTETMLNSRAITAEMTLRIVRALARGALRFSEIDRAINATNHPALSARLKKMTRDGLIVRHVHKLGPPAVVSYELTPLGADLAKPASALIDWTEHNGDQVQAARDYYKSITTPA
jgi:DNA-binding HxlR family transcriptional regulator